MRVGKQIVGYDGQEEICDKTQIDAKVRVYTHTRKIFTFKGPLQNSQTPHSDVIFLFLYLPWAQFHQHSTYSFYAHRSRKLKKRQSSQQCHLALLGPTSVKAVGKTLVKLTPDDKSACVQNTYTLKCVRSSEVNLSELNAKMGTL